MDSEEIQKFSQKKTNKNNCPKVVRGHVVDTAKNVFDKKRNKMGQSLG